LKPIFSSHLILDACCILNICATGHFSEILSSLPSACFVSEVVRSKELKSLHRLEADYLQGSSQFNEVIVQGLLQVVDFETEAEQISFLDYIMELGDDGESATFALAGQRGWAVATDDRKAISFARQNFPEMKIISTPQIIHDWATQNKVDAQRLKSILEQVHKIGKYQPGRHELLFDWWMNAIQ
jgi:predicted nucleic acid-binding protein